MLLSAWWPWATSTMNSTASPVATRSFRSFLRKEEIGGFERGPFVAIRERVILREATQEERRSRPEIPWGRQRSVPCASHGRLDRTGGDDTWFTAPTGKDPIVHAMNIFGYRKPLARPAPW